MLPAARPLGPDAEGQWVRRWLSPEWNRVVDAWVAEQLDGRIVGEPVTYRARFWSVTRCYRTTDGLVWFKENNPGHRFEAGLVAALAEVVPDAVVVPLAVERERGWLLAEDHGPTLGHPDVADQRTRCRVVDALARLQCAVLGKLEVQPGMVTLAPREAGDQVRAIAKDWARLPLGHPLRIGAGELQRAEAAADVLDRDLAQLSMPLDLELNDVYAANIFAAGPRFFDFGNAIWGHPFVSLHSFLTSVVEWTGAPLRSADREELYDVYLAHWGDRRAEVEATEALERVHRLVSWVRLIPHADPVEIRARAEIPLKYLAEATA
ncbi:hypothetical protein [Kribbella albertanoniae]|uniref:Aminoglycoside phosphotransferase family protein n=1 Tax=Kribbella albertanoniae TaxID=1266829 RepID=A0A4R4PYY8_9ACTN|nr:hypothetical protein [Kribbella albertanoniae]TDC27669.1 hypothetical protein E1261_20160 [Kribbella albertanoniae]